MRLYEKSQISIDLILQSASKLFLEKGYKATSMNDIAKTANLSKGAIYHHFKSKNDVFEHMCRKIEKNNEERMIEIIENHTLTGSEKMQTLLDYMFNSVLNDEIRSVFTSMLDLPEYLAFYVKQIYEVIAVKAVKPIIEEGVADGTLNVAYPKETSEVIVILTNLWLAPLYSFNDEILIVKIKIFNTILNSLGLVIPEKTMKNYLTNLNSFNKEKLND